MLLFAPSLYTHYVSSVQCSLIRSVCPSLHVDTVTGGSSSNFTDYAAAQKGPQDVLRGATSHPVHPNHRTAYAYMELYGSGGQEPEAGHMQQSPGDTGGQLMKRSQSLALPANMVLEANGQSTSNRHCFRRADLNTRSTRQFPIKGTDDDSGASPLLRSQLQQQKADKGLPKRRITNQNIEPASSKAVWLAQNALRDVDSPRVGSGLIKVGLGQDPEEDGRNGC